LVDNEDHPMTRSPDHPMKLLIAANHRVDLWTVPAWFSDRLSHDFPKIQTVIATDDTISQEIPDAEVALTPSIRPEQLLAAKKLRWIHSPSAAVHQFLFPEFLNSDVILTNGRDVHGPVVAEHVIALIFALAKNLPAAVRFQQQHVWGQEIAWGPGHRPRELAGATLGLVGLGSIGRAVAKHAAALGMQVIAVREHPENPKPESVHEALPSSRLDELLARSDYVVLAAPVTQSTQKMIARPQLAKMKPDSYLINVGRGALVDEPALIDALRDHKIGGAALDVFEKEPLPSDSPLWALDNLLITPHTAGMTEKLWERQYALFSENLHRYLNGEPLLALVNKQSGY
jgi:phosphoglycerate dehydrogenase-like enzyme